MPSFISYYPSAGSALATPTLSGEYNEEELVNFLCSVGGRHRMENGITFIKESAATQRPPFGILGVCSEP